MYVLQAGLLESGDHTSASPQTLSPTVSTSSSSGLSLVLVGPCGDLVLTVWCWLTDLLAGILAEEWVERRLPVATGVVRVAARWLPVV